MKGSFYTLEGELLVPTDHTRGPWHAEHCHAGPPSGLLARAIEQAMPAQLLTRITIDLRRPIPFAPCSVTTQIIKAGRQASTVRATLSVASTVCAVADGLLLQAQPSLAMPSYQQQLSQPDESAGLGDFPLRKALHALPCFRGDGVQVRYPPGHDAEPGPTALWMRTVPLLDSEAPSPFQRICPLADCGNAIGRNAEPWHVRFANADLTIALHRPPQGEWLGSDAVSYWENDGIGLADAQLFDEHGCVGRALQTLILRAD